jgi:HEAT repeat protein
MESSSSAQTAMTLEEFSEKFNPLPAQEKVRYIYTNIDSLQKEEKIRFLLSVLKEEKSSPLVKATALKFLRQSAYQESEIYRDFINDQFRAISNAAKRAVKEFGEKQKTDGYYAEAVLRKLNSLADKERRLKILRAIARLKAPWVLKVLLDSLGDPCEKNRDFLVTDLSQRVIWNPAPLYEKLTKPPWYARSAVLRILARRKDVQALSTLEKVLDDPNVDVRRCAAETLGEIGGREALAMIVRLTKDKSAYVRQTASEALRKVSNVRFSG